MNVLKLHFTVYVHVDVLHQLVCLLFWIDELELVLVFLHCLSLLELFDIREVNRVCFPV